MNAQELPSDHKPFVPDPDREYSVQIAVVMDGNNEADVANAMQQTHDTVLKHAGQWRTSGVTWTKFKADDHKLSRFLRDLEEGEGRPLTDVRHYLRQHKRTAVLVVAYAEVSRGLAPLT